MNAEKLREVLAPKAVAPRGLLRFLEQFAAGRSLYSDEDSAYEKFAALPDEEIEGLYARWIIEKEDE